MKTLIFTLLALVGISQAQITYDGGRTQVGDSLRWGDTHDSTGYLRARGNAIARDSAGTWKTITTDSCSKALSLGVGTVLPNKKLELSYEVRTSAGNTDSSQVKIRFDTRYCRGVSGNFCESWVPAGRFKPDTSSQIIDSLITVATGNGVTWTPTRQVFDVPGGSQIRACVDGYKDGGSATDTTYFRRFVIRTSGLPAGGTPPSSVSLSGVTLGSVDVTSSALPSGAATSANQTNASAKTQIVDGSGNVIASTSNNLNVQCANCSGSGVSATDEASFTAGSSSFALGGGAYQVTQTSNPLTTGQQGAFQATRFRALHVNLRDSTGAVLGNSTTPLQVSLANTGSNGTAVSVNCSNCSGSGVSATDETAFTAGSSTFAPGGGLYQVTQTSNPLTTGQQGAFQTTRFRALHVTLRDSTGAVFGNSTTPIQVSLANTAANGTAVKVDGSAVTQPVSGTVTANAGTNLNTSALALDATLGRAQGSTTSGQTGPIIQGAVTTSAPSYTTAQTSPLSLTTAGALRTDASATTQPVSGTVTANQGGTWTVQPGNTANTTAWKVDNSAVNQPVVGAAAHGSAISGAPVRQGNRGRTSDITVVSNDQTVDQVATIDGKAVFMPYAIRPSKWSYAPPTAGLTATTAVKVKNGAAGLRVCTTSLQVMTEHQTTSTEVVVYASPGAGAATDTLWRGWAQAAGGGASAPLPVDFCTPNTGDSLKVRELTATATSGVLVNLQGYTTAE